MNLEDAFARFERDGYAELGHVLDDAEREALCERADAMMRGEVTYPGLFFQHDTATGRYQDLDRGKGYEGPSLRYRKLEKIEKDPLFLALINHPTFEQVARALIAGPIVIYRAVLFNKPARGGTVLPFHQDGGSFWGLDEDPFLQIWVALDDAPIGSGCLEFAPGTHRGGLATPLGGLIPDAVIEAAGPRAKRTLVPAKAGDAILVHNHVWHGSGVNETDLPRRGVSICYMSAERRCQRKRRAPRQFVQVF